MKRFLLAVIAILGLGSAWGQVVIAKQGFETTGETWTISTGASNISTNTGSGDTPVNQRIRTGSRSWQVSNSSSGTTLELSNINVSTYSSVKITIRLASLSTTTGNGADSPDNIGVFVNTGSGFPGTADVTISGNTNARWGYNATLSATTTAGTPLTQQAPQGGTNTNNYAVIEVNIPNGTTTVALRVIALNDNNNEIWAIDDIELTGNDASCTAPSPATSFTSANASQNSLDVSFTRGNGTGGVLVLARAGGAVNAEPVNGTTYTANAAFGSGDQIGTGNYVVYNGAANGVSSASGNLPVSGLTAGTTYHFAVYEYNGSGSSACYGTANELTGSAAALCAPTNATAFAATPAITQMGLSWTAPTCSDEVLVIARQGSAVTATPSGDGAAYTANAAFGTGTEVVAGEYVVYKGSGNSVTVTNLASATIYHYRIFSRKGTAWSSGATLSSITLCNPPATQATALGTANISNTQMDINWVRGDGNNVIVLARAGSAVNANPLSGTTYTANATFGSGNQVGTNNFVVYNGAGTSVAVTGLTAGVTYHFAIYEYSDANVCYLSPALTGNATTTAPELQLEYPVATHVNCGATATFANTGVGNTASLTFRIRNMGSGPLSLTSLPLVIGGTNANQFSITQQPASPIAAGAFEDVVVQFAPTSAGAKTANITIANNDANEGSCILNLSGLGLPANDECSTATALAVSPSLSCGGAVSGSTAGATDSGVAAILCNSFTGTADDDVWYSFIATSATHIITVVGASPLDAVVDLRSGACNGTNIQCADVTDSGGTETLTAGSLTPGQTYLVRVYGYGSTVGSQGAFTICITTPPPPSYFRTKQSGPWSSASTWESSADNLVWSDAAAAPGTGDLNISLRSPHTVTVSSNTSLDQTVIESGATLEIASGTTLTIANGSGTDLTVQGILRNAGTVTTTGTIAVSNGGRYQHNYLSGSGSIPTTTWEMGSTCEILGTSSGLGNLNQNYHHFIWNNSVHGSAAINVVGNLDNIAGNFTIQNTGTGSLRLTGGTANTLIVGGNVEIATGATLELGNDGATSTLQIAGNLTVSGTLELMDGNNNDVSGYIQVGGNLVATGGTITENSSGTLHTITFTGTGLRTAAFGTLSNRVNIEVDKTMGGGVSLQSNLTLPANTTLTLTNGLLSLNGSNLIATNSGVSIVGGGSNQYIQTNGAGALQRTVSNASVIFPVGNSTYNPVVMALNAGSTSLGARVIDAVYSSGFTGDLVADKVVNRTWDITGTIPATRNLTLELEWAAAQETSGFTRAACYVSHYVSGGWSGDTPAAANGGGPYSQARGGITSLSPFAVASQGALPVELTNFKAVAVPAGVALSWRTATEQNNAYFDIERSADGRSFEAIGQVAGQGDSQAPVDYTFVDAKPLAGLSYYRLRQVDYDGAFAYYGPLSVNREGLTPGASQLWPIPAQDRVWLQLPTEPSANGVEITLYDLSGQLQWRRSIADKSQLLEIPLIKLPAGIYLLRWYDGSYTGQHRLVVE